MDMQGPSILSQAKQISVQRMCPAEYRTFSCAPGEDMEEDDDDGPAAKT